MVSHYITTALNLVVVVVVVAFHYIRLPLLLSLRQIKKKKTSNWILYRPIPRRFAERGTARRTILGKAWKYHKKVDPGLITRLFAVDVFKRRIMRSRSRYYYYYFFFFDVTFSHVSVMRLRGKEGGGFAARNAISMSVPRLFFVTLQRVYRVFSHCQHC